MQSHALSLMMSPKCMMLLSLGDRDSEQDDQRPVTQAPRGGRWQGDSLPCGEQTLPRGNAGRPKTSECRM